MKADPGVLSVSTKAEGNLYFSGKVDAHAAYNNGVIINVEIII
jgi:hypothetical protein